MTISTDAPQGSPAFGGAAPAHTALAGFHAALEAFRARAAAQPVVASRLFGEPQDWLDLLEYKLAPNLGADPCLVVAVAGGTNTGKSTVYNMLLQRDTSPVRLTAAATCRPLLAASARRLGEFSTGKLLTAFRPLPLLDPESVVDGNSPKNALFITESARLPDAFVLLDTPDVDSIDLANWEVADHIRAAGDVVIAVITGEKYKDERVIEFFRAARAAGRMVLPLMNKANPAADFATARLQVQEFCRDAGLEAPACFVVAHDFGIADEFAGRTVGPLGGESDLFEHLCALPVGEIKEAVYRDTLRHFAAGAGEFAADAARFAAELRGAVRALEQIVQVSAEAYDAQPGAEVGLLMLEFVHAKRGKMGQLYEKSMNKLLEVSGGAARAFAGWLRGAASAPAGAEKPSAPEADRINQEDLRRQVTEGLRAFYSECERVSAPAAALLRPRLDDIDAAAAEAAVLRDTLKAESVSESFRMHAFQVMEQWWQEEKGQRMLVEFSDKLLMLAPGVIYALAMPGTGAGEVALLTAYPLAQQLAIRALVFKFGGRMVRLIGPWQQEQRAALRAALAAQVLGPALGGIHDAIALLEGEEMVAMRRHLVELQGQA